MEFVYPPIGRCDQHGVPDGRVRVAAMGITSISFEVAGIGDTADLKHSYLEVELRRNNTSTKGIVADDDAASDANNTRFTYITNNLGHTLFKEMNLYLNGIMMSTQTGMYAYSDFLETLLNYNRDEGETLLVPQFG